MKGIETQVLRIVQELGVASQGAIARKVGVSEEFISTICQELMEDGYLINRKNGKFKITLKSNRKLSPVRSRGHIAVLKGGG
ncbi:MAG: MarR family transcriptional regulator [Nitrospinae bacterium]|nr:MarR family transcriptional regulator [Nitrospinota bacterium]